MMDADELLGRSAREIAAHVRERRITAQEIVRAHVDRIESRNPVVGAFRVIRRERAFAEARALDARADLHALPLAGVPVAIKDNVPVSGEAMRAGSMALPDVPADADHEVVRRLRAAGAIVVGITNTPELCIWGTCDSAFGTARSPWNPKRTAGGSSGGSAAAVGAGLVPIALGNDGLGSIRIPAAACGVVGMKPGSGVVPSGLGANAWYGLAENGPLARDVADAALMLSILADRPDLATAAAPARPLRIAYSTRSPAPGVRVDPAFTRATREAAALLAAAGHEVVEADPSYPLRYAVSIMAHWFAGPVADAEPLDLARLEPRTRRHLQVGRLALRLGLVRTEDRRAWQRLHATFFTYHDALLTPALAATPVVADGWRTRSWLDNVIANTRYAPFAAAWNFAGFPAASLPVGFHEDGMPLSVQIVAPTGRDARVLSIARALADGGHAGRDNEPSFRPAFVDP